MEYMEIKDVKIACGKCGLCVFSNLDTKIIKISEIKQNKYNKTGDQHRAISRHRRTRRSPGAPPSGGGTKERPNALVKRKVRPKLKIVIILKLFQTRMSFFPLLRTKEDILNVVKRLVHPNMKILSLITHPHDVSNPRRRRIWSHFFSFLLHTKSILVAL